MKISFDTIAESAIENFKGGEGTFHVHMFQDMNNKIMKGRLVPGSSIGTHMHETNSEIIYVLSGVGTMEYEDTKEKLYPGDCHYCPQGATHSLSNESYASHCLSIYLYSAEHFRSILLCITSN